MRASTNGLHIVESGELGQDELQETRAVEVVETRAGMRSHDDLVQFVLNAFSTDDLQSLGIPRQRLKGVVVDVEAQLGGKAHTAHHAQRVIAECDVGIEWRSNDAIFQVVDAIEGVHEFAETIFIQTDGHRVNGEVTAVLVVFQRTILHDRLSRVVAVALLASTDKLHLESPRFHLRCAEILEHTQMCLTAEFLLQQLCHFNAASHNHHIDVLRRTLEEDVAHVATHHIALHAEFVGAAANQVENVLIKYLCKFLIAI